MDRRTFFKTTVAGLLSAILPTGRQVTALPLAMPLFSCMVAGFQYHDGPTLIDRLRPGDRLTLLREPDNSYDRLAVAVHTGDSHLGYLPRTGNGVPAALMDQGRRLRARVLTVAPQARPWNMLEIAVEVEVDPATAGKLAPPRLYRPYG